MHVEYERLVKVLTLHVIVVQENLCGMDLMLFVYKEMSLKMALKLKQYRKLVLQDVKVPLLPNDVEKVIKVLHSSGATVDQGIARIRLYLALKKLHRAISL